MKIVLLFKTAPIDMSIQLFSYLCYEKMMTVATTDIPDFRNRAKTVGANVNRVIQQNRFAEHCCSFYLQFASKSRGVTFYVQKLETVPRV